MFIITKQFKDKKMGMVTQYFTGFTSIPMVGDAPVFTQSKKDAKQYSGTTMAAQDTILIGYKGLKIEKL